ncbi:MAG: hypothetical protein ACPGWR_03975 [Ardenticatenaceae bacterium]
MLTNEEWKESVEHLTGSDLSFKVVTLKDFWRYPSADPRLLPYLEDLIHDKTPCLLGIPYVFGEVRWLAAKALTAEREALEICKPVRLQNVVRPIDMKEYTSARKTAQVELKVGVEGVLENIAILRDMGYLPLIDLNLYPKLKEEARELTYKAPVLVPA